MKNKVKKIIWSLLILIILFSINTKVFGWSQIISDAGDFITTGEDSGQAKIDQKELQATSGFIYNILLTAGVVVAVIVATVLGIKFMISGAEGQAKVKEMLVPFIAGCIIVFGGFGFWKIALTIGERMEEAAGKSAMDTVISGANKIKDELHHEFQGQ